MQLESLQPFHRFCPEFMYSDPCGKYTYRHRVWVQSPGGAQTRRSTGFQSRRSAAVQNCKLLIQVVCTTSILCTRGFYNDGCNKGYDKLKTFVFSRQR